MKRSNVNLHNPNNYVTREFLWHPPITNWVKCNVEGSFIGLPGTAACGGIFGDHNAKHLGRFLMNN